SHMPDDGSFKSDAARPPSLKPLPEPASEIHVRVHPCTEQGRDFAPRRSASVKPKKPIKKTTYADRQTPPGASANTTRPGVPPTHRRLHCHQNSPLSAPLGYESGTSVEQYRSER